MVNQKGQGIMNAQPVQLQSTPFSKIHKTGYSDPRPIDGMEIPDLRFDVVQKG